MRTAAEYKDLLRTGRWFHSLPDALQDALLAAAAVRELPAGARLFSRGDPPTGRFGLVDGAIRISAVAASGREALLTLAEPPTWIGEVAVFDRLPRTHDAIADTDATVVHVSQDGLDAILAAEPVHWRELGVLVAGKLRLTFTAMEDMALMPPATRLARRLLLMTEGYGEWYDRTRRAIAVRQEQLAMMLNLSRQTTNQLLRDLEARGLVRLAYGEIEILDLPGLRVAAEGRSL